MFYYMHGTKLKIQMTLKSKLFFGGGGGHFLNLKINERIRIKSNIRNHDFTFVDLRFLKVVEQSFNIIYWYCLVDVNLHVTEITINVYKVYCTCQCLIQGLYALLFVTGRKLS